MSPRHREALAHLLYGIQSDGGFILLSGEVGTGKTTVCRCLLEQIPQDVDTAYILNPKLTAQELLATACDELKIQYPQDASIKVLVDRLNAFLLESHQAGRRTVLIIDEAQNLSVDVLEQLRLLTNLETNQRKLLQIILLGQPELLTLLAKQELRQLSQRVTARFHLDALNKEEVGDYIQHRLDIAGAKGSLFPPAAVNRVFQISKGIPRLINLVCDRALLGTYVQNRLQVDTVTINNAAKEILGESPRKQNRWLIVAAAVVVLAVMAGLTQLSTELSTPEDSSESPVIASDLPADDSTSSVLASVSESSQTHQQDNPTIDTASFATEPEPANEEEIKTTASPAAEDAETASYVSPTVATPATPAITLQEAATDQNSVSLSLASSSPAESGSIALVKSLADIEGHESRSAAFETLMSLWGIEVELSGNVAPCDVAAVSGLACLTKLGSLRDVAHLNRPVIVNLPNEVDQPWYVVSALEGDAVSVTKNNQTQVVSANDVLEVWSGFYTLIWRSPPAYRDPAKKGDSGATVDWLQTQLAFVDGSNAPSILEGTVFDSALEARVKKFQISVGLVPDGIVGAQTWIHLNSADASDIPKLVK